MDCAEEVSLLRREFSQQRGVFDLSFDVAQSKMTVEFNPEWISPERIVEIAGKTGMRAEVWHGKSQASESFWRRRGRLLLASLSGCALLIALTIQAVSSGDILLTFAAHHAHEGTPPAAHFFLLVAVLAGAVPAMGKAIQGIRKARLDMNVLVVVSVIGALYLEEWPEAATVVFLYSAANLVETWSLRRARREISRLIETAPSEACLKHGDHWHRVPVEEVPEGSLVRVSPGEKIPFDGEVVSGWSEVNQALLTGESVEVKKKPGDRVYAGTWNVKEPIEIRTATKASDTTFARILRMIENSDRRRAPTEQWIERFARYYTPLMIGLALGVGVIPPLLWGAEWSKWFYQGMVILLIACPCALVISTPVTIAAAVTSAARQGVLIKGGVYLEAAARWSGVLGEDSMQRLREALRTTGQATVGDKLKLALGSSREDAALETADVVFLSDDPGRLDFFFAHARRALRNVQGNVLFALLAKATFLGLALSGNANLWMAVAADMGATLAVTCNGLRMGRPLRAVARQA